VFQEDNSILSNNRFERICDLDKEMGGYLKATILEGSEFI
jgi:hypothetical protein